MNLVVRINDNLDLSRFDLCDNPEKEEKELRALQGQHVQGKLVENVFVVLDRPHTQHMFEVHKDCTILSAVVYLEPKLLGELENLVSQANNGRVRDFHGNSVGCSFDLFDATKGWRDLSFLATHTRHEDEKGWVTHKPV